jgi:TolB-like protein
MRHLLLLAPPILALGLAAPAHAARTIAVAYFDNDSGRAELDPLRKGLADMLITDLAGLGSIQIVEREKLNAVIAELELAKSKFIDPKTAQKLGKGLSAEYIMTGSYLVQGDAMRIDSRLVQVATGRIAAAEKVEGKRDDFFALEKELVDALVKALDLKLSSSEKGKLRSNATQSFSAWARYSAGLDAHDRGDDVEARRQFQAALDSDPNYRAAKTATERLHAIFESSAQRHDLAVDQMRRALDPKAEDFGEKLNEVLGEVADPTDAKQMAKKLALLTWVAENDYLQTGAMGFSRVVLEGLGLVSGYLQDPDEWDRIPLLCEYFMTRYPKDRMAQPQCKAYLQSVERMRAAFAGAEGLERARESWAQSRAQAVDWSRIVIELDPQIRKLFAIYARKASRR